MKKSTSFSFFAIFLVLLFFLSMRMQVEHTKDETRNTSIEDEWRNNVAGLPRGIVQSESELEMKPLWENSRLKADHENFTCVLAMAVGISQKQNVNLIVGKFLIANCSIILFHYDGNVDEWRDFQWNDKAIHILAHSQTKWWFAKRFLHPDVVSIYNYIFLWDEDLGVENFHPGRYMQLKFSEGLEISQPALDPELSSDIHHRITVRDKKTKVHRRVYDYRGSLNCSDESKGPPCTGWVEGMAPVFSRAAWRCAWHLIQNDLIHGWGLDMKLGYCAQGDRTKKVGVIDTEFVVHLGIPSLGGSSAIKNFFLIALEQLGDSLKEIRGSASGDNMLLGGSPAYGVKLLRFKNPEPNLRKKLPSQRSLDLRTHIRRQSTAELEKFKKRWNRAVREDKEWADRFVSSTRRRSVKT